MLVNDKLERKLENPSFDVEAAMKELALLYIKEMNVCCAYSNEGEKVI